MNQTEKRYLVQRIQVIREEKCGQMQTELRRTEEAFPRLDNSEKKQIVITALLTPNTQKANDARSRMGKHEPVAGTHSYRYNEIEFVWEWPEEVKTNKQLSVINERHRARIKKLDERTDEITDEIWLGDSNTALNMLKAFRKESF